jgi:TolB-like protein/Tfp pilus assembly protein PilF
VSQPNPAVFLSYASQDAEVAGRICDALRAAGVQVWFDRSELRGGESWDWQIREQIRDCRLFVALISQHTEARDEGYFRREWKLAVDRSHDMAEKKTFIVPVVVDATSERGASVPEKFRELQWTRLPDERAMSALVTRILGLLGTPPAASSRPLLLHRDSDPTPRRMQRSPRLPALRWSLAALVALLVGAGLWSLKQHRAERDQAGASQIAPSRPAARIAAASAASVHSIAVLPFANLSGDPQQEYFSDGMSDELISALAQINGLQVTARTSSFFFKGKDVDLATIARRLNVGAIVEGSVRRDGSMVRVTAELVNPVSGFHLWSQKYDRQLKSVLALQAEIAATIAEQLRVPLLGTATLRAEVGGTQSPEAYDVYLRGKQLAFASNGEPDTRAALADFDRAIALDPGFGAAYGRRAVALMDLTGYVRVAERDALREEARSAVQQAVTLAPDRADVHTAMWYVLTAGFFDFKAAASECERALALAPGASLPHQAAALQALWTGHKDAAVELQRRAVALDPQNPEAFRLLLNLLARAGRFEEAFAGIEDLRKILPREDAIKTMLLTLYLLQGRLDVIRQQRLCEDPPRHECLATLKHAAGDIAGAAAELDFLKAKYGDAIAYDYAGIYAGWNEIPQALQWLETALRLRDPAMVYIKVDPMMDALRREARFQAVEQALHFPD